MTYETELNRDWTGFNQHLPTTGFAMNILSVQIAACRSKTTVSCQWLCGQQLLAARVVIWLILTYCCWLTEAHQTFENTKSSIEDTIQQEPDLAE